VGVGVFVIDPASGRIADADADADADGGSGVYRWGRGEGS
jgi:hypothetical protein